MPCKMTALESYTKGRKYQRLRERSCCDLEKYKPHIIPSQKKGHVHQLFCTLTRRHISREPADIERHVKGKRYMRALTRYNECQRLGVPFKPCSKVPRMDQQQQELDHGPREGSTTDSEASDGETDDSMSDLYPAEDFEDELEDAGLEEDIENMAVGDASKNAEQVTVGKKRKNPGFTKKTTFKKSKQLKLNPEQQQMFKDAR
ncbi:surfeit locus protein 2-like isoform X2 [Acanthaster planci]|nr:surfeit locus protein 2-like isoform X2 [Acanthaster planci]